MVAHTGEGGTAQKREALVGLALIRCTLQRLGFLRRKVPPLDFAFQLGALTTLEVRIRGSLLIILVVNRIVAL